VSLPSSILGAAHADPQTKALHEELAEVNKKIQRNQVDLAPEHERSPSPQPLYDINGLRLNTREIRAKDKLMQRRSDLIEDLIKTDPGYRPPADYRQPFPLCPHLFSGVRNGSYRLMSALCSAEY
jgi:splicing factor 1